MKEKTKNCIYSSLLCSFFVIPYMYIHLLKYVCNMSILSLYFQLSVSNATQVTLRNVGFNLSGNFTCEVTVEAPTFYTAMATNVLKVVGK